MCIRDSHYNDYVHCSQKLSGEESKRKVTFDLPEMQFKRKEKTGPVLTDLSTLFQSGDYVANRSNYWAMLFFSLVATSIWLLEMPCCIFRFVRLRLCLCLVEVCLSIWPQFWACSEERLRTGLSIQATWSCFIATAVSHVTTSGYELYIVNSFVAQSHWD